MCFLSFVADIIGTSNVTKAGQNVIQGLAVPSLDSDNYDIISRSNYWKLFWKKSVLEYLKRKSKLLKSKQSPSEIPVNEFIFSQNWTLL